MNGQVIVCIDSVLRLPVHGQPCATSVQGIIVAGHSFVVCARRAPKVIVEEQAGQVTSASAAVHEVECALEHR